MTEASNISPRTNEEIASLPDMSFFGLLVADHVNALLAYWDNKQVCRFANKAYVEWFGLTREDLVGKLNMKQLLGPAYEFTFPYITSALEGKLQQFEREITIPGGEVRHSMINYYPYIVEGEVRGFFSFVVDISRQKDEEKKLSQFAAIVESSADAIISKKLDGTIVTWNRGAESILGYKFNEVLGRHITILIPADLLEEERILLSRLLKGDNIEKYETTRVRKDGTTINVSITLSAIKDKRGSITGISKVLRDITKAKSAEAELNASNDRNKIFIRQAPNAIAMFDKEMRYLAASQKWIDDYQIGSREFIGFSHYEIFPNLPDDWKLVHAEALSGKTNKCSEAKYERNDGSTRWITWDVRPWFISEGHIGGLLICTSDITDLKENVAERRRIELILEKSNRIARIATWEVNILSEKVTWGKIANEIFETADNYIPSVQSTMGFYKKGKHLDRLMAAIIDATKHAIPYDLEAEITTAKGNSRWIRIIGDSEFKEGNCIRRFGVFQDITKIKKTQEDLNLAHDKLNEMFKKETEEKIRKYSMLESKTKEMEQFAYITSHDLREPLLTIKNYLEILEEDYGETLSTGAHNYTTAMSKAANRMDVLINGLLDYSRLSKVKQLQQVDCNETLTEVMADLNSLITSAKAIITVSELPLLQAYPLELKLLFQNIIHNAIKFHKKDVKPELFISAKEVENRWQFQIRDNGIGIAEKDRERIFFMFQRLHGRSEYEGTGIGLTHCKKIAELHNGKIWVESVQGEWSSFYFNILTNNQTVTDEKTRLGVTG